MTKETNRNGLSFYFEYQWYDPDGWCVRTWGDGGIYDRRITYDEIHHVTLVDDSRGGRTHQAAESAEARPTVAEPSAERATEGSRPSDSEDVTAMFDGNDLPAYLRGEKPGAAGTAGDQDDEATLGPTAARATAVTEVPRSSTEIRPPPLKPLAAIDKRARMGGS
jgi:hypothetical protein